MTRRLLASSRRPSATGASIPSPVGGWNARDSIASMPQSDAVFLDNWFPEDSYVRVRPGFKPFATIPEDIWEPAEPDLHNVRTLLSYKSREGVGKLFAAAEDGIYDITAGGEQLTPEVAATDGRFQYLNFVTAGGSFLFCCNGVDDVLLYDGTDWKELNEESDPALTGLPSSSITNVTNFKHRLYLCEKDSLDFWYLPVNSFAGEAQRYPMQAIFKRGGYLVAIDSWTMDGGSGIDDFLILITSEGEVAVFQGYDPANIGNWALVGLFYIGRPLSRRCFVKLGGDLGILTSQGLFQISQALQTADASDRLAISDKIRNAWHSYIEQGKDEFGWEATVFPEGSFLLVNVPVKSFPEFNSQYSYQFVMNLTSGAWCRFVGMPAETWCTHEGKLFFAQHNRIFQAWEGTDDNLQPIDARVKTAFMYPSGRGNLSQITLLRPIFDATSADIPVQLLVDSDFSQKELQPSYLEYAQQSSLWDVALWDEAVWSGTSVQAHWRTVFHSPGKALALRLRIFNQGATIIWNATDFILKKGGMM